MTHQAIALAAPPVAAPAPPWLAVAGAKGGVGKTMLAVNLALLLARHGHRPLLVDFDPGCGNVGVHLRLAGRRDLEHLTAGDLDPAAAIVPGPGGIHVLPGRSGSTALAHATSERLAGLLSRLAGALANYDVVIVDTGAGLGPATLAVAERADLVLGVTTPDIAALTDTYALCKVLHQRGRELPRLVVNQVRSRDEAMRTAGKLAAVTRRFLDSELQLCGFVARDPLVEISIRDQFPLALAGGQGPGCGDLQALCAAVLAVLPPLQARRAAPPGRRVRLRPAAR